MSAQDRLFLAVMLLSLIGLVGILGMIQDNAQIRETSTVINQDHVDYCNMAISREADDVHLRSEGCI